MASVTTDRRRGINSSAAIKVPCKSSTTGNITLSAEQTIDGVSCTAGDRVLVMNQTTASENGIYEVSTGTWNRAPDWDGFFDVLTWTFVPVYSGSTQKGYYRVTTTGTITVGTTSVAFEATDVDSLLRADLANTATGYGDDLVGHINPDTGAVATTVAAKLDRLKFLKEDFGGAEDGATDDSTEIQAMLDSSVITIVDLQHKSCKINTALSVPAGKKLLNVNFTAGTAGMNMVLVNTGCKVTGKFTGTGTVSTVERAIYPATSGVTDVEVDIEITNITYGLHAAPVSGSNPERWKGTVYVHSIVGTVGASEGYGVILEGAEDCNLVVHAKTIARHALYLSAGACKNNCVLHIDDCGNYAAQIYSTSAQSECADNHIEIFAKNLTEDVAGQSGPIAIVQKANRNTVIVHVAGNTTTSYAAYVEGASGGPYPTGNKIIDGTISGQFIGADVIRMVNADGTVVRGNRIDAYAVNNVIASRYTGTNGSAHGGFIHDNVIDAQAQSIGGVYVEMNAQPVYVGINDITNNSTGTRVTDSTTGTGYRTGYSRIDRGQTTVACSSNAQGSQATSFNMNIANAKVFTCASSFSVTGVGQFPTWVSSVGSTGVTIEAYNGAAAQNVTVDWEARGD